MLLGNFKRRPTRRNGQEGYLLIVLMIMVTLITMAALATGPSIATQIKRDREEEMVHRGAQYSRAIKKFYKKFGRYPVSLDQLDNTNNIRFLRRRYKDPVTGKDFKLLHFGEVKLTPKPVGSSTGPGLVTDTSNSNQNSSLFTTSPKSDADQPKDASDISKPIGTGPNFGGGPIIGVESTSEKQSLKAFNNKDHYNQWEFIYDPTMDRGGLIRGPYVPSQLGSGGVIPNGMTPTTTPQTSPFGNPLNNSPLTTSPQR